MAKTIPLSERLVGKLRKLGFTERKAKIVAKGLMPFIRHQIGAATAAEIERNVEAQHVEAQKQRTERLKPLPNVVGGKSDCPISVATGYSLRVDLPVAPMEGLKGIELLRVMDGLSSTATYLVAAVKSTDGIVAVRKLANNWFNVKFYPNMAYWKRTPDEWQALGAHDFLTREHYQRMHVTQDTLEEVLEQLRLQAQPKSRVKRLVDRFLTVTLRPLLKSFGYLKQEAAA